MRLIDVNGFFDIPYEMFAVIQEDTYIVADAVDSDTRYVMANYSKPEIAKRAMKKLQWAYAAEMAKTPETSKSVRSYFRFPNEYEGSA